MAKSCWLEKEENAQIKDKAVVITKDNDEHIVLEQTRGRRIFWRCFGGFFGGIFILLSPAFFADSTGQGIGVLCGGILLLLAGLYAAGNFKEIKFDNSLGCITWRAGAKCFPVSVRTISKADVQSVHIHFLPGYSTIYHGVPDRWRLTITVAGSNIKLHTDNKESIATYLANRIKAFTAI